MDTKKMQFTKICFEKSIDKKKDCFKMNIRYKIDYP